MGGRDEFQSKLEMFWETWEAVRSDSLKILGRLTLTLAEQGVKDNPAYSQPKFALTSSITSLRGLTHQSVATPAHTSKLHPLTLSQSQAQQRAMHNHSSCGIQLLQHWPRKGLCRPGSELVSMGQGILGFQIPWFCFKRGTETQGGHILLIYRKGSGRGRTRDKPRVGLLRSKGTIV